MPNEVRRGRPKATSRPTLEEAAAELFLERSYDTTTIDDIASRAGISRSAFFGYFGAKSDVLWTDVDDALARIVPGEHATIDEIAELIAAAVKPWGTTVPWALRDAQVMQTVGILQATAVARIEPVGRRIAAALQSDELSAANARVTASSILSVTAGAIVEWVAAGTERGPVDEAVRTALAPLTSAYTAHETANR